MAQTSLTSPKASPKASPNKASPKKNTAPSAFTAVAIAAPDQSVSISNEAIAVRAFEKYQARGCVHGFDREDWAAATEELIVRTGGAAK